MSNENSVIKEAYKSVYDFNQIGGAFDKDPEARVDLQLSMLFSELEEAIEGFENRDAANLLQEACDVWVVASGLLQHLAVAGFDVNTAMQRVCASNMSKFVPKGKPLQYDSEFYATFNEEYGVSVIKDVTGKIRKPKSFVSVDVSDLVPPHFFKGQV